MAITDSYATAQQYRTITKHTDATDDAQITSDLTAVSRYLERRLNRFFTKDAVAVPRYFYPTSTSAIGNPEAENPYAVQPRLNRYIYVADMAAVPTEVLIDVNRDGLWSGDTALVIGEQYGGTAGVAGDFELLPRNAAVGPEVRPWNVIYLPTWSTILGFYPGARVRVTAQWGWPAVPQAIINATCALTGILRLETPRATRTITEIGTVIGLSPDANKIIDQLALAYGTVTF